MENQLLIALGAAVLIVGSIFCIRQIYLIVQADASCRGLKHPKFWGLLAASGNNKSGLLLYLIIRRKHPIITMSDTQKLFIKNCKKKFSIGLIFLTTGAITCLLGIIGIF